MRRSWGDRCAVVIMTLSVWFAGVAAATEPWRIVILGGLDPMLPSVFAQEREFRRVVGAAAPDGVEFYTDPIDSTRFQGADLMPEYLALMRKKYQQRKIDLVVVWSDFGLEFAERYHEQLWPGKPVLVHAIEEERLRRRGLPADFASLPVRIDVDGTLAIAEALQPRALRLVVVAGTSDFDQLWAQRTADTARRRSTRHWVPEVWSGVPMPELRERLAALNLNTAVVYPFMFRDRNGRSYFPHELVEPMVQASGAPIYSWYPAYLELGVTAGSFINPADHGRRAGALAVLILRGEVAAAGATLPPIPPHCTAHVGRITALGLDVNALPAGCELTYQPPSLWREHGGKVIAGLALLVLQALTIAGLLVERRRRQTAEHDAALRRHELSRATRVSALGELSASIAHEVGQPLSAIVANTDTAELVLRNGAGGPIDLQQILRDVRRDALRAYEVVRRLHALLEKSPAERVPLDLDAVLDEALMVVTHEASRRRITVERRFESGGALLMGDRVQLQQMLLNLVINAMDAMEGAPPQQRVLSLSVQPADGGFELKVADRGHGLSADAQRRLFESFFTTKPHGLGLGLSIVRTIVEVHGGRVLAAAREGGGTVFTVWLPRTAPAVRQPAEGIGASIADAGSSRVQDS